MTTNASCSNQWSTTSTKDGQNKCFPTINKSLPTNPVIDCVKVTHPTNANVNNHKRIFSCKKDLSEEDMFTPMKKNLKISATILI